MSPRLILEAERRGIRAGSRSIDNVASLLVWIRRLDFCDGFKFEAVNSEDTEKAWNV